MEQGYSSSVTKLSETVQYRLIRFAVALLALLACGSTCAGFSDNATDYCVVDGECDDGTVCFRGECTPTCTDQDDCDDAFVCRSEARPANDDVVDVCTDELPPVDAQCMAHADCADAFPATGAQCGTDGTCYVPAFSLLIRDTSVAPTDIDGAVGADIAAVFLADPTTGAPVAWADTLEFHDDVESTRNAPDGTPRALQPDRMCVDGAFEETTTSLGGDGGYLLVRFLEDAATSRNGSTAAVVTTPPTTWNVVVVEWGANCGATGDDSYEVFACAAPTHRATVPERHCTQRLGAAPQGGVLEIAAAEN